MLQTLFHLIPSAHFHVNIFELCGGHLFLKDLQAPDIHASDFRVLAIENLRNLLERGATRFDEEEVYKNDLKQKPSLQEHRYSD